MPSANEDYVSYLLQFWSVQRDKGRIWIAAVRCTATDELRRFANLDALIRFLQDEFGNGGPTEGVSQLALQETKSTRPKPGDIERPLDRP